MLKQKIEVEIPVSLLNNILEIRREQTGEAKDMEWAIRFMQKDMVNVYLNATDNIEEAVATFK